MGKIHPINRILSGPVKFCLKDINFQKAGIFLKDGTIQFKNQEAAIEYGMNRCRQALQGHNPFERQVNIKGRRVIQEFQGTKTGLRGHNTTEVTIHGHPDTYAEGCTMAISEGDFASFKKNKCEKVMYVVNSKGEYYKMEKIPGFDYSEIDIWDTFGDFCVKWMREIFGGKGAPEKQKRLLEYGLQNKNLNCFYEYLDNVGYSPKNFPKYMVDGSHAFWLKYANRFGVKTETNFSNFKNI